MAIYTESAVQYNGVQRESIEDMINDERVVPSESDDFISEGMEVILGMTENYNMVMEHIGRSELLALEQTGEQLVYTEGVIGSIFSTIKKFLMKIWEKIKSLFKRFIMMIDSYTKNDKAFINKYRQQIYRHKSLSDFTFKGYVYTIDTGKIDKMMEELEKVSNKNLKAAQNSDSEIKKGNYTSAEDLQKNIIDKMDDLIELGRGDILANYPKGKSGRYTSEEFKKEFKALLRNGEDEKQELDGSNSSEIDVDAMVTELQNYRETKKIVDNAFKRSKKAIDNDNKEIDRFSKEYGKNSPVENPDDEFYSQSSSSDDVLKYGQAKEFDSDTPINDCIRWIKTNQYIKTFDYSSLTSMRPGDTKEFEVLLASNKKVKVTITYEKGNKVTLRVTNKEAHATKGKLIQIAFKVINQTKQCLVDIDTIVLQALKERSRQYKACLVKIVYHNPKNEEAYNESYSYNNQFQQNFTSPLSNIEFK